ncbi:TonB family protein [bacterium]|nr:TonB family protein [bacterium]
MTEDFELTVARDNNNPNTIDLEKALGAKYRIITRIGSGGFADVYLGEQLLLSRKVAIKILHAHYARQSDLLKRFEREARSAASLSHPNIIDIYDVGESDGVHYIVMKYIDGETLNQRMHREGILPVPVSIHIIRQLAEALDYAHTNNVIHRDIKPANVMIDPYGRPMLMDFGVARIQVEGNLTKTGTVLGTPHYLPPEQPLGKPVDARSDIYSLGIMFYEMLSGQLPFHDENAVAVLFKHINEPPQPLNTIVSDINPDLAALVHRMIEKDPPKRPQSAGEVAEVLHALSAIYPPPTPIAVRKSTPGITDNTEQLILLAREHVDQNKLDKALEIYTVVIQRQPQNTSAKMEISKILRVMFTRIQDHASKQEFDKAQKLIVSIKPMVHDNDRFENLRAMIDLEERLWAEKQGTMTAMDSDAVERMIEQEKERIEERRSVDIPPPPPISQSIQSQPSISQTMIQRKSPFFRIAVLVGIGLVLIAATLFLFKPKAQTIAEDTQGINLLRRLVQFKQPEKAPEAEALGQVSVTSEPAGATVWVGDEKKGVTPLQLADLPIGKYSIQVKLPGYEDFKQDVELTKEQSTLDLPVTLKLVDPTQLKGSVRIVSVPDGADVILDGKVLGKTPFKWQRAPVGDQILVFKKEGYEDRSVTVSVIANKTTSFETQLAEIPKVVEPVAPVEKPIAPGTLVELGPGVEPPKVVKRNIAEFSTMMKQLKREGTVKLNILVSENGKVLDVKVLESPHPVLEQAAIRLVKEWTYSPATKNGVPVRVWFPAAINFKKGTG